MRWDEIDTQVCSVARTLSVIGDRWTMLILRDSFLGVKRFDQFQKTLGIPRHRLSDRLAKLVEAGVLSKQPYQDKPPRYEYRLTEKGLDLYPILIGLANWGDKWEADQDGPPVDYIHVNCGHRMQPKLVCDHCNEPLQPKQVRTQIGPGMRNKLQRGESVGFPDDAIPPALRR